MPDWCETLCVNLPTTQRRAAVDQLDWPAGSVGALNVCGCDVLEGGARCHRRSRAGGLGPLREVDCNHQWSVSMSAVGRGWSSWRHRANTGRENPKTQHWTWTRWTRPGFPDRKSPTWFWLLMTGGVEYFHLASCSLSCWMHHCNWAKRSCRRRGETTAKYWKGEIHIAIKH